MLAALKDGAWNRSTLALELLLQLDAAGTGTGGASSDLLAALGTAYARHERLGEAAATFERSALLQPSTQRLTAHGLHNLELISGATRAPPVLERTCDEARDDGGWRDASGRAEADECDIETRGLNLTANGV